MIETLDKRGRAVRVSVPDTNSAVFVAVRNAVKADSGTRSLVTARATLYTARDVLSSAHRAGVRDLADVSRAWLATLGSKERTLLANAIDADRDALDSDLFPVLNLSRRTLAKLSADVVADPNLVVQAQRPRAIFSPAEFPLVIELAIALAASLKSLIRFVEPGTAVPMFNAARSVAGWANANQPGLTPSRLRIPLLYAWENSVADAAGAKRATVLARTLGHVLVNVPPECQLSTSVVVEGRCLWQGSVTSASTPAADASAATIRAVRMGCERVVIAALARTQRSKTEAGTRAKSEDVALAEMRSGTLTAPRLLGIVGEVESWPSWTRRYIDVEAATTKRDRLLGRLLVALAEAVFPTPAEIGCLLTLLLISTMTSPESLRELCLNDVDVPQLRNGRRASVGIIRYQKQRGKYVPEPLIIDARGSHSVGRYLELARALTADLRAVAQPASTGHVLLIIDSERLRRGDSAIGVALVETSSAVIDSVGHRLFKAALVVSNSLAGQQFTVFAQAREQRHQQRLDDARCGDRPLAPLQPIRPWEGRALPSRVRKAAKTEMILMHGYVRAAHDHNLQTLLEHYTTSDVQRAVGSHVVRGWQEGMASIAVLPALKAGQNAASGRAIRMGTGLTCTAPRQPPPPRRIGSATGVCVEIGSRFCASCPAARVDPESRHAVVDRARDLLMTAQLDGTPEIERLALRAEAEQLQRLVPQNDATAAVEIDERRRRWG